MYLMSLSGRSQELLLLLMEKVYNLFSCKTSFSFIDKKHFELFLLLIIAFLNLITVMRIRVKHLLSSPLTGIHSLYAPSP